MPLYSCSFQLVEAWPVLVDVEEMHQGSTEQGFQMVQQGSTQLGVELKLLIVLTHHTLSTLGTPEIRYKSFKKYLKFSLIF